MEKSLAEALSDTGYSKYSDEKILQSMILDGLKSSDYVELVTSLVNNLCLFNQIDENVHPIDDNSEEAIQNFMMELNGFLRELACPYKSLTSGDLSKRLDSPNSRLLLLHYLITEYQTAQIIHSQPRSTPTTSQLVSPHGDATHDQLKKMLMGLGFPKPPATITPTQLFGKVEAKLKELINKYPNAAGNPLLKSDLNPTQWDQLDALNSRLTSEYEARREMLLKRLDVTIQSFLWSGKAKSRKEEAVSIYQPLRKQMSERSVVKMTQVLSARDHMINIERTNANRSKTETPVNKVIMGSVPDRGGRTNELTAPPPEMPAFAKRQAPPPQEQRDGKRPHSSAYRGDRGGGHHGRGGRVQGNWNKSAGGRGQRY